MEHKFVPGDTGKPLFVCFHGTGGSLEDLIPLVHQIHPGASVLSFAGDVDENGLKRFFKRKAMGVLDEDDLRFRAQAMSERCEALYRQYSLHDHKKIAIGYSNGANLLAGMLYTGYVSFDVYSLHHPMLPFKTLKPPTLKPLDVHIHAGVNDPICPYEQVKTLQTDLTQAGAQVQVFDYTQGHQISNAEIVQTQTLLGS